MSHILYITASVRGFRAAVAEENNFTPEIDDNATEHQSLTRQLGHLFLETWKKQQPQINIVQRDLSHLPPAFISQGWVAAAFTAQAQRSAEQQQLLTMSDELIAEVKQARTIVIATPMYNYGMPAVLKAWFDQIIRINQTFSFDLARGDEPLEPILTGKRLLLVTSCGEFGFAAGGVREHMNFLGPHIQLLSRYLGAQAFYEVAVEYQEFADHRHLTSVTQAKERCIALARQFAETEAELGQP